MTSPMFLLLKTKAAERDQFEMLLLRVKSIAYLGSNGTILAKQALESIVQEITDAGIK